MRDQGCMREGSRLDRTAACPWRYNGLVRAQRTCSETSSDRAHMLNRRRPAHACTLHVPQSTTTKLRAARAIRLQQRVSVHAHLQMSVREPPGMRVQWVPSCATAGVILRASGHARVLTGYCSSACTRVLSY